MIIFVTFGDYENPKNGGAKFSSAFINLLKSTNQNVEIVSYYSLNPQRKKHLRKLWALFYLIFKRVPLPVGYFFSKEVIKSIRKIMVSNYNAPLTIVVDHLEMCYVVDEVVNNVQSKLNLIHLSHNDEPHIFKQKIKFKYLYSIFEKFSSYIDFEKQIFNQFDRVLSISNTEAQVYKKRYPNIPISVVPPLFTYNPKAKVYEKVCTLKKIVFAADFSWFPNLDAYEWIIGELLPVLPESYKIYIYGLNQDLLKSPTRIFEKRVVFCGYVDNISEIWQDATFSLAPMRIGAGINIKLAESLYNNVPVIASPLAIKGLEGNMLNGVITSDINPEKWIDLMDKHSDPVEYKLLVDLIQYPTFHEYVEFIKSILNEK